eukprot:gene5996-2752_t
MAILTSGLTKHVYVCAKISRISILYHRRFFGGTHIWSQNRRQAIAINSGQNQLDPGDASPPRWVAGEDNTVMLL